MQVQVLVQYYHYPHIVHHHHHRLSRLGFLVYYRKVGVKVEEGKPDEPVGTIISAAKLLGVGAPNAHANIK
jgi:hypothetical protein